MNIKTISEISVPIFKRNGVKSAYIFGSFARGDQTDESDIDFLIEYAPQAKKSLLVRARIINELKDALQRDVDVATENSLLPSIRRNVLNERSVIYEAE
ncbi:MAG: nucleotidyltransferase family protein [Bacillota bacterium]|nr:nucleotidyltransferase family protein [Bacillota bacterium]